MSSTPARAMGLGSEPFVAGAPADPILFPRALRVSELFSRPHGSWRIVLRRGHVQGAAVPSYRSLDDLTRTVNGTGHTGPSEFCATTAQPRHTRASVGGSFAATWARMVLKRCSSERGEREKRF